MKTPLMVFKGVTKTFTRRSGFLGGNVVLAVDKIDLAVFSPELLVLAGRSGAGKSTIARLMVGLTWPTSGRIMFDGLELNRRKTAGPLAGCRQIVFQNPYRSLSPRLQVAEIVVEPAQIIGISVDAHRLIDLVGLPSRVAGQRPAQLSAGERQRVAIARALSTNPRLLVFDEPTSALDPITADGINKVIFQLKRERAVVVVSHDLTMQKAADRIVTVEDGRSTISQSNKIHATPP